MARSRRLLVLVAWLLAIVASAAPGPATSIEVAAELDPDLVGVGQFVVLTLEARIEGSGDLDLDPSFGLENLEIVAGPSQSQQVSFLNGRVSRRQALSWTLRALEAGPARVRDLRLAVNNELFELPEQVLEVQEQPVDQPDAYGRPRRAPDPFELLEPFDQLRRRRSAPAAEPKLFLRAEASPRQPFVGQQVLYSLLLFTQADVGAVNPDNLPDFEGFWLLDIEQPQRPKSVMTEVQGERYGRVVLLQKALFPLRPGPLTIDPVAARLIARIPETSWLGTVRGFNKEYELTSNAISLDVQPLPPPPTGFHGAVGHLDLAAELRPGRVSVNEAATLEVTLAGRGHVQGLPGPALPEFPGLRAFPPEQTSHEKVVGTTVRGEKTWTWVLVPERPGVWEIPALTYPFFDPDSRGFEVAATAPLRLTAEPDAAEAPAPGSDAEAGDTASAAAGVTANDTEARRASLGVLAALIGGATLLLVAVGRRPARRFVARRRAGRRLRSGLRAAAAGGVPARVADLVEEAWRQFLAERWQIGPAAAPGEWSRLLAERGAGPAATKAAAQLADDLQYLRYAPELSSHDSLRQEIVELSARLARALR